MLTFGGQNINNPDARATWLTSRGPQKVIKRSETSINGIGFSSPPPRATKREVSTLQRYMAEKQNSQNSKLNFPQNFARNLKQQLYDSSAIKASTAVEKLPASEMYSKKVSNGPFGSPIVNRNKPMCLEQGPPRAFSPTYAKTTIFEDGKVKYQTIRSGYKNASNINLGSINAEIEPIKRRHYQQDRDFYNSNIFNGGEIQYKKKVLDSKYNTLNVEQNDEKRWKEIQSPMVKEKRLFSPQPKSRDPSFDIGSNDDILSERAVGNRKNVTSYRPQETVSRIKMFPGKHLNNPSDKIVLQSPDVLIQQNQQLQDKNFKQQRANMVNRSTKDMQKVMNQDKRDYLAPKKQKQETQEDKIDLQKDLQMHLKRQDDRKIALQFQSGAKLSILGTMTGDPFKKLHEQKASRMLGVVQQAHKKTEQTMMGIEQKKRKLQPEEGQVFAFKDEELRPQMQKVASMQNKESLEQQIQEKQNEKQMQKKMVEKYEKNMAKGEQTQSKPRFRF